MAGDGPADAAAGVLAAFGPGSRLAGYLLEEQLGAGGMAVVFRAVDERLGRRVALKILAPALAADQAFRQRFIRESRTAAAVDDPYIIPVYEAGEADGVLFIAMRLVPGKDAGTLLHAQGPLPPGRAAAIISQVASALDAAHAAGLVHRDVKPANMLIDARPGRPDHVYLADFGISKGALPSIGLTGAGQLIGTPDYMAPEQIQGRAVDGVPTSTPLLVRHLSCSPASRRSSGITVWPSSGRSRLSRHRRSARCARGCPRRWTACSPRPWQKHHRTGSQHARSSPRRCRQRSASCPPPQARRGLRRTRPARWLEAGSGRHPRQGGTDHSPPR